MIDFLQAEHNAEVDAATDFLFKTQIPQFALFLLDSVEKASDVSTLNVCTLMHRAGLSFSLSKKIRILTYSILGINLRYLGLVVKAMGRVDKSRHLHTTLQGAASLLLSEATARIVKNELNRQLRRQMKKLKLPLEVRGRKGERESK